ncbi:hypothetical protein SKAU_G00052750 [Synaphobranchus kaupii]|uniref:Uncharacterized protein n=1 Tax=Synaphobranchus kaupii TaxID=118154 RepID=A0A9Q1G3H8_SYNKA|nr:hypothetical protein SKAU_G00052750 [Synaphobranchus kaupii]
MLPLSAWCPPKLDLGVVTPACGPSLLSVRQDESHSERPVCLPDPELTQLGCAHAAHAEPGLGPATASSHPPAVHVNHPKVELCLHLKYLPSLTFHPCRCLTPESGNGAPGKREGSAGSGPGAPQEREGEVAELISVRKQGTGQRL